MGSHSYANANKARGTEANANKCRKVACSVFATQANEQAFHWLFVGCPNEGTSTSVRLRTYFSFKYRLQTDSIRLLAEHLPHKRMLFAYTSTLWISCAFSCSFCIRVQMWMRLNNCNHLRKKTKLRVIEKKPRRLVDSRFGLKKLKACKLWYMLLRVIYLFLW